VASITRHTCWKLTVVTSCAQLMRDLLAIAKFLSVQTTVINAL